LRNLAVTFLSPFVNVSVDFCALASSTLFVNVALIVKSFASIAETALILASSAALVNWISIVSSLPLIVTIFSTEIYPSLLTTTVYVPFATLGVLMADSEAIAEAVATTAVPLTTLTAAPVTLVVTVIAPSLKVVILSLSTIARNQCLWVCMRCGVTF